MKILKELRNNFKLTQKELANKLSIEQTAVSQYEGNYYPSFKIIKKISEIFDVSIDYLLLENKCFYPKDLNFIKLARNLDNSNNFKMKNLIKENIKNLINNIDNLNIKIKQDNIGENLKDNFHLNLKILRNLNNYTQKQIAEKLEIVYSVVGMYEIKNFPSIDKMIKLSKLFNCSIHTLVTGEKLFFDFKDKNFAEIILLADNLLAIEDKKFLLKLMENVIKNN